MSVPYYLPHSPFWTTGQRTAHREKIQFTSMPTEEDLSRYPALELAVRCFQPCHYRVGYTDEPGKPRRGCGHTDFAHAGIHQPSLHACAVCALLIAWLEMST